MRQKTREIIDLVAALIFTTFSRWSWDSTNCDAGVQFD